jgi:uncharacterized membrane protein
MPPTTSGQYRFTTDAVVAQPSIRKVDLDDIRYSLSQGLDDFLAIPTQLIFLCIIFPVVGLAAGRAASGSDLLPLLYPLVAGISLLGPVLAVGIYELSRRREAGLPVVWYNVFDVWKSPAIISIIGMAFMLLVIFVAWVGVAKGIYAMTIGAGGATSVGLFAEHMLDTAAGWHMMIYGNLAGLFFAMLVLALTVVSVPMLLDRNVSVGVAIRTSVQAVLANPVTMAVWGVTVAVILLLGCLPIFVGLAVAMPVLGHATWHLYRRMVVSS